VLTLRALSNVTHAGPTIPKDAPDIPKERAVNMTENTSREAIVTSLLEPIRTFCRANAD
jgi:hypothetical protein